MHVRPNPALLQALAQAQQVRRQVADRLPESQNAAPAAARMERVAPPGVPSGPGPRVAAGAGLDPAAPRGSHVNLVV